MIPVVDHRHELHSIGVRCIKVAGLSQVTLIVQAFVHCAITDSVEDLNYSVQLDLTVLPSYDSRVLRFERPRVERDHLLAYRAYLVIKDGSYWALKSKNIAPEELSTVGPTRYLRFESENHVLNRDVNVGAPEKIVLDHLAHGDAEELHFWDAVLVLPPVDRLAPQVDYINGELDHVVIIVHTML